MSLRVMIMVLVVVLVWKVWDYSDLPSAGPDPLNFRNEGGGDNIEDAAQMPPDHKESDDVVDQHNEIKHLPPVLAAPTKPEELVSPMLSFKICAGFVVFEV